MAATAYASLVSLLNTMDQIHTHPLVSTFFDINQNKYLCEKINLFLDFVEKYSDVDTVEIEDLVRRIADAARGAEDVIEVHAADRVRGRESPSFLVDLQMIMEKMESIKEEVIKVKEEIGKSSSCFPDLPSSSSSSSSSPPAIDDTTNMVGFDDYVEKLWDDLIGDNVDRSIISITGMGGIGKTTLARNLYKNSHVMRHFNVRVWVTVSQESSARKIFLQALSCLGGGSINKDIADDRELSDELHKTLFNRRYLVVLDDVWSVEIWDKIKFYFPENKNGSRIIITTRETKLVDYIGSSAVRIRFLDEEYSWKLFCEKTFPQEEFPYELEEVGKKIVKKCVGLPLAITVIGGLLAKSPRTQEYWEKIAKDKSLILNLGDNNPLSILNLSYKYLPVCLKPCFLHFGFYPEDCEIEVSKVIKLWVAEGFIKAKRDQSLEEVAESYFNELVDRNLLFLQCYIAQTFKICFIHDLVRDLCIKIGEKENFFYVQRNVDGNRHFITDQTMTRFYPQESHASSSILEPLIVPVDRAAPTKTRLLRVFHFADQSQYFDALREEVSMRILEDCSNKENGYLLPSSLSRFWSLQTLYLKSDNEVLAPTEIWKMPLLRHIDIRNLCLPDPPPQSDKDVYVLENLQTLKSVKNLIFSGEVCKRIPHIKKLDIDCDYSLQNGACPYYHLENVGRFNKLESLYYYCRYVGDPFQNIKFPSSLKELTIWNCKLEWSYMAVFASLPHLQFLYLGGNAVAGMEWVFVDERFVSLKGLRMTQCGDLTKWIARSSNFPMLEELFIWNLHELDEIPFGMGEIPTLQRINLHFCSKSANISAVKILYEQERFENLGLQLAIQCDEPELLSEEIQEFGLTCQNLWICCESLSLLVIFFHFYFLIVVARP